LENKYVELLSVDDNAAKTLHSIQFKRST